MEFIDKYYKVIKLGYFVLVFIVICIFNSLLFGVETLKAEFFLFCLINFFLVFLSYWVIFEVFTLRINYAFRISIFIVALYLVFYLVYAVSICSISFLEKSYPSHRMSEAVGRLYSFSSLQELFQREKFSWMSGYFYFHLFILSIGGLVDRYRYSMKQNLELQKLNGNLELERLKAQIEPHFLFNTLNNIYRLVLDNDKAANTVLKLSDLLRFTLYESNNKSIPIGIEVQFLEDYIELEKIRHYDNVRIEYDFSSVKNKSYEIAPLLFINFIENAFKHGVHHTIESTFVFIVLKQVDNELVFTIRNKVPVTTKKPSKGGGIGIENVQRRLELLYPNRHVLKIDREANTFTVNLKIQIV